MEVGVGGELGEIFGVVAAEFGFVGGEWARDGFDLAERERGAEAEELVDAAGQVERPAAVDKRAGDGDLELGGGGVFGGGAGAEFVVPVSAELRSPKAGTGAGAGIGGAEVKIGKLADAQAGGAGVEGEFHGGPTEYVDDAEGKLKLAGGEFGGAIRLG